MFDEPDDPENGWYTVKTNGERTVIHLYGSPYSYLTAKRLSGSVHGSSELLEFYFNNKGVLTWGATCDGGGHVNSHPTKNDFYEIYYFGKKYSLIYHFE